MATVKAKINSCKNQILDDWFSSIINELEIDKILLKEDIATNEMKETYSALMSSNQDDVFKMSRETSSMYFVQKMLVDYFNEIKKSKLNFNKLAFDLGNSKLLSWVEINDGDELSEDKLIMAEAMINAKYEPFGFHLSTTIIESSDLVPVPTHYISPVLK